MFGQEPGSDDICPVCFWQDDIVQLRWPDFAGGANRPSLIEAQANYPNFGAAERRLVQHVRGAAASEEIDPAWRSFDPARDAVERRVSGVDYGMTFVDDRTKYYYWVERA